MTRNGSDLPAFLEWWEESGQNVKSILCRPNAVRNDNTQSEGTRF